MERGCGCAERGVALKAALLAISKGDTAEARTQVGKAATSARRDVDALRRQAAVRLGLRK